ncbi:enoyl-CoA hydratase/isomerase family protein [Actinocrispum sp. NPDC049592]|uniref:enoyl-CoA hydratase/isomerase family protein n=1 Tax=Actinocrispum sp. NPDC049592 TaxID=3154835 RepID=UPI0034140A7B
MTVDYTCADGIAQIHLNRPERLNAVVPALVEGLLAGFERAASGGARAVVLAGRGRAFCAGHDLKEPVPAETLAQTQARLWSLQDVTLAVRRFPGIVISAVHGYALGAGCEFALGCDLIVASASAQFGFPEVGVGLSVTGGISALLPRVVGLPRAKELLLLGERFGASQALSWGLINRVAPDGEHLGAALSIAEEIVARPPVAASLAKQVLDLGTDANLEQALATEVQHALLTSVSGENTKPREEFGNA